MSATNDQETEQLIIKLLKKLKRKGKNIQSFLWQLMDQFENEQFDEKNDEHKFNINNQKITLLYRKTYLNVCKFGHQIKALRQKHLSIEACIECGHRNNNNTQNETKSDNKQILQYLNQYNTNQIPFGPHQKQKAAVKAWVTNGRDKEWPLHYAAIVGDVAKIKQLSKTKNINMDSQRTDWGNKTPIASAARYGQLESVIELIKHGANPMPTPDKGNSTPYVEAVYWNHKAVIIFYKQYIKYLYNFDINNDTNLECFKCYNYDLHFNKHVINGTMSQYVYCVNCALKNVENVKEKQADNLRIERRIIKTIKENPSISVDTLCQMKDVKSLHTILKEIIVSGEAHAYSLWLLDIDNFKAINTHLTHAIADTKIQALAQVLKDLEPLTFRQWRQNGYDGINKIWAFRQGGDEFALVIHCNNQKTNILERLYESIRNNINNIKVDNMATIKHVTVSIGVCMGDGANSYEEMLKKADEVAATVKNGEKNGIAIYYPLWKRMYKHFSWLK